MIKVVLVIHLLIAAAMIAIVLMQKSEGGGLGIGGGGGAGGFLTGRGTANLLTRLTAGLALGFFITSLTLTLLASTPNRGASRFGTPPAQNGQTAPAGDASTGSEAPGAGLLDRLKERSGGGSQVPAVPQNQ